MSLSYDIRSNSVPMRITRTPSSSNWPRTLAGVARRQQAGQGVGELHRVDRLGDRCARRPARLPRYCTTASRSGRASSFGQSARGSALQRANRRRAVAIDRPRIVPATRNVAASCPRTLRQRQHGRMAHGRGRIVIADRQGRAGRRRVESSSRRNTSLRSRSSTFSVKPSQPLAEIAFGAIVDDRPSQSASRSPDRLPTRG